MADNPCYVPEKELALDSSSSSSSRLPTLQAESQRRWWRHITVEPLLACYYVSISISQISGQHLLLQKACSPSEQPTSTKCIDEEASQVVVAEISTWKSIVQNSLPLLFVLFAGSWSDNHGGVRKPLMILPVIGQILTDFALIVNVYFWQWSPTAAALGESLPSALCGGRGTLSIGVTSYLADITSHQTRTVRMGISTAFVFVGAPVGSALGGILTQEIGLIPVFSLCAAMNVFGLVSLWWVKETGDSTAVKQSHRCCDASQMIQAVQTATKRREGYNRCCILLLALATFFLLGPFMGEFSVLYLFVRRKFEWSEVDFGFYAAFKMLVVLFGTLFTMGFLCYWLKVQDALIGIIACVFQAVASITYAFVNTSWVMYVVPLLEFMHGAALAVQKSIVSKMVDGDEMGQVNAVLCVVEAIVPLVVFPLYSKLYQVTLHVFPGAFFVLGAALTLPAIIIFCLVYFLTRSKTSPVDTNIESVSHQNLSIITMGNNKEIVGK